MSCGYRNNVIFLRPFDRYEMNVEDAMCLLIESIQIKIKEKKKASRVLIVEILSNEKTV